MYKPLFHIWVILDKTLWFEHPLFEKCLRNTALAAVKAIATACSLGTPNFQSKRLLGGVLHSVT